MFNILYGRPFFYQWDLNQYIVVNDKNIKEVHFYNKNENNALIVDVNELQQASVPNILLQQSEDIIAYAYCYKNDGRFTKYEQQFKIIPRQKPADYIYTETEVKTFEDLENYIKELEEKINNSIQITIDEELSSISTNPVQNKAIVKNLFIEDKKIYLGSEMGYLAWDSGNYALLKPLEEADSLLIVPYEKDNGKYSIVLEKEQTRKLQFNSSINRFAFYSSEQVDGYDLYVREDNDSFRKIANGEDIPEEKELHFILDISGDYYYFLNGYSSQKRLVPMSIEKARYDYNVENVLSIIDDFDVTFFKLTTKTEGFTDKYADKSLEKIIKSGEGNSSILLAGGITASGENSLAFGEGTIAEGNNQTVIGKFNEVSKSDMFIIGNGTSDSKRKNLLTIDQAGNLNTIGQIEDGKGNRLDKVAEKLDTIWYGDEEEWIYNYYGHQPYEIYENGTEFLISMNNPISKPGIYEIYIGNIIGSRFLFNEVSDVWDVSDEQIEISGLAEIVRFTYQSGELYIYSPTILKIDEKYNLRIKYISTKKIPSKYLDIDFPNMALLKEITYSQLKNLKDAHALIPGQMYRITDYTFTTTQFDTRSAGHRFDIVVKALDEQTLDENAGATYNEKDLYFKSYNAKLEAWKLKYCLDNDTARFGWADKDNGKGIIYYMKDEWNNECPYDFKNALFKRYLVLDDSPSGQLADLDGTYAGFLGEIKGLSIEDENDFIWCYTFHGLEDDCDSSLVIVNADYNPKNRVEGNSIGQTNAFISIDGLENNTVWILNNIVFFDISNDYYRLSAWNKIYERCYGMSFMGSNQGNIIYSDNVNLIFGKFCYNNILGSEGHENTFSDHCAHNKLDGGCYRNIFGNDCINNTFGNDCTYNILSSTCNNNTFGNNCNDNTLNGHCSYNTFGNKCDNNIFRNDCTNNKFDDNCMKLDFFRNCNYCNVFSSTNSMRYSPKFYDLSFIIIYLDDTSAWYDKNNIRYFYDISTSKWNQIDKQSALDYIFT